MHTVWALLVHLAQFEMLLQQAALSELKIYPDSQAKHLLLSVKLQSMQFFIEEIRQHVLLNAERA